MSKAIEGAALLGTAVGLGALMLFPGTALFFNNPIFYQALESAALGGLALEAGAIAGALTSNAGSDLQFRQPASPRAIIRGIRRFGGVCVYPSTTGSHHDQFNFVVVLAGHPIWAYEAMYLDGRRVFFNVGSAGNVTRNGYNFGGDADGNTYVGPDGTHYNFGGKVFCSPWFGDQADGTVDGHLTANDPTWAAQANGDAPSLTGCAYCYVKIEYDPSLFPSRPDIQFTIHGKCDIWDPRTQSRGFSANWALNVADVFTDAEFGLNDPTVNQAQLIAAANVSDEQLDLAAGGTESRYCLHMLSDTSKSPGDQLQEMMAGAAGEVSNIGGEWYIWPAYFQGASFELGPDDFAEEFSPEPCRSARDLFNRVTGTYIAPNFPFNDVGNLYDKNGWYRGTLENLFPLGFQPTNYPQYACDPAHGFAADEYLAEDSGIPQPREIGQSTVLSVVQSQRVAKIYLMRNRQQGSSNWFMKLAAYRMQAKDCFHMTFPQLGWTEKLFEVGQMPFIVEPDTANEGAMRMRVSISVRETAASVYQWSTAEEQTIYCRPALGGGPPPIPAAPTNLLLTSSAATAIVGLDGIVRPRILVSWDEPLDGYTTQIQMQIQPVNGAWQDAGLVDVANTEGFIDSVIAGAQYDVRIRSVRPNGVTSAWLEVDGYTVSLTLSQLSQTALAPGTLVGEAFGDGTAGIIVPTETVKVGYLPLTLLPAGAVTLTGLQQARLYFVYYIDPYFLGGAVTPIATQNQADFQGRRGYFLIDSLVTPSAGAMGTGGTPGAGMRYSPTAFHDYGSRTTTNPGSAFDGDINTAAGVSGYDSGTAQTYGDYAVVGFPPIALSYATTITAMLSGVLIQGDASTASVNLTIGSTVTTQDLSTGQASYTAAIPANTNLASVSLEFIVQAIGDASDAAPPAGEPLRRSQARVNVNVAEVYLQ